MKKNPNPLRGEALKIYLLSFFAYSVSYIGRKGYSASMSEICGALDMSKALAGAISTGYLACYGAGQFFSGLAADKLSPRLQITIALTGAGVCNLIMGFSNAPAMLMIFWCLNGLFNSMMWASVIKTIAVWLPKENYGVAGTNIAATIPLGSIVSYLVSSFCLRFFKWNVTFYVCGTLVLLYALIWHVFTGRKREYIESMERAAAVIPAADASSSSEGKARSGITLAACVFSTGIIFTVLGILFNGIIKDGVTEWVPTFITEYYQVSPSLSSALSTVLPIVNLSGAYIAKWIDSHLTHNEMKCSGILFLVCFSALLLLVLIGKHSLIAAVLLISVSTATMLGVNNMFLTMIPLHFASIGRSSSVSGLLNASSYLSAALSSALIGVVAQQKGWDATIILWVLVALIGVILCLVGASFWARGRERLKR